jgi:hypothetical protein
MGYLVVIAGTILPVAVLLVMKKYIMRLSMPVLGIILLGGAYGFLGTLSGLVMFDKYPATGGTLMSFVTVLFGVLINFDIWFQVKKVSP